MKIAHEWRRETFPLGTSNQTAATAGARDIYLRAADTNFCRDKIG